MAEADGVSVNPTPITAGEEVTVSYNGELVGKDPEQIYLHAGVGFGDNWNDVTDVAMIQKNDDTWEAQLKLNTNERFNFCFKDSADNWDNNQGDNWSFEVHDGQQYS